MFKILITGISGFVAGHFLDFLYDNDISAEILGLSRSTPQRDLNKYSDKLDLKLSLIDLTNKDELRNIISSFKPNYVLHLASFSSVGYSWKHPTDSFMNNCNIFLNLIEVIREVVPDCRILSVGSSEEYGNVAKEDLPLRENQKLDPVNPYAVARLSQELLSKVYVNAFGMNIIMTRSFNHIGPRQDDRFVVPSFINRIIKIKNNNKTDGEIETGDLSIIRDFIDVRDVVKAYYLLLIKGKTGEIYNICSGKAIRLSELISYIEAEVGVKVKTKTNFELIRPSDNKEIVGSSYKLQSELGWKIEWNIKETIRDMVKEKL